MSGKDFTGAYGSMWLNNVMRFQERGITIPSRIPFMRTLRYSLWEVAWSIGLTIFFLILTVMYFFLPWSPKPILDVLPLSGLWNGIWMGVPLSIYLGWKLGQAVANWSPYRASTQEGMTAWILVRIFGLNRNKHSAHEYLIQRGGVKQSVKCFTWVGSTKVPRFPNPTNPNLVPEGTGLTEGIIRPRGKHLEEPERILSE